MTRSEQDKYLKIAFDILTKANFPFIEGEDYNTDGDDGEQPIEIREPQDGRSLMILLYLSTYDLSVNISFKESKILINADYFDNFISYDCEYNDPLYESRIRSFTKILKDKIALDNRCFDFNSGIISRGDKIETFLDN